MGIWFRNLRIIIISIIPNIVPLLIIAGGMGFLNIPLKPSVILVFSISFGICIDDSIHFLARYKQELINNNFNSLSATRESLKKVGVSMVYTSLILLGGFIVFALSKFQGTVTVGVISSITVIIAMISNLILLPSLIISFHRKS